MDGLAVAQRMRDDPAVRGAITMMLSSDSVNEDAPRCRELGLPNYLVKPIKQAVLLDMIMTVLEMGGETRMEPSQTATTTGGRRLRILLAEDNAAAQLVARRRLGSQGHDVWVAGSGFEVLQVLRQAEFDLVLMDVEMPEMNGLEATRAIRRTEADSGSDRHMPIVAMTAYATKEDQERCLQAGMDGFIGKPVNHEELYREIERLLSPEETRKPPAADLDAALESTGGDRELLQEAVALFLEEDYPRHLKELRRAIKHGDAPAVRAAAHGIKGAINSLGGHSAGTAALLLQEMGRKGNLEGASALLQELEDEVARFRDFYQHHEPVAEGRPVAT